jgi:hypothetical protein
MSMERASNARTRQLATYLELAELFLSKRSAIGSVKSRNSRTRMLGPGPLSIAAECDQFIARFPERSEFLMMRGTIAFDSTAASGNTHESRGTP